MRLLKRLSRRSQPARARDGSTTTETAVVLPVFFLMLFAFVEFGHVFMTIHTLNSAARRAARLGASETTSTADVTALAYKITSAAISTSRATMLVKNGDVFDNPDGNSFDGPQPAKFEGPQLNVLAVPDVNTSAVPDEDASKIDYAELPDIELKTAPRRQLFIVRISVPYSDVAIFAPDWLGGITVYGQCVMRKE